MGLIEVFCPGLQLPPEPKPGWGPVLGQKTLLLAVARELEKGAVATDQEALKKLNRGTSHNTLNQAKKRYVPKDANPWWKWVIENIGRS
jgi:hypothetical protein